LATFRRLPFQGIDR